MSLLMRGSCRPDGRNLRSSLFKPPAACNDRRMLSFVPDIAPILAFALASVVLAITPGPVMALQLSRTVNFGRAHGLAVGFGAMSGIAVHTTLVALGISVLIVAAPLLFLALKIAGAAYLLWLAFQAIVNGGGLKLSAKAATTPTVRQSYLTGVGITLLNPKVELFFLGAEFIIVSIPLMVLNVVLAEQFTRLLTRTKWIQRALNYSFAAVFTTFAAVILTAQARH